MANPRSGRRREDGQPAARTASQPRRPAKETRRPAKETRRPAKEPRSQGGATLLANVKALGGEGGRIGCRWGWSFASAGAGDRFSISRNGAPPPDRFGLPAEREAR